MITFKTFTLSNGLKFIVNEDQATTRATFNIMYNVGAKDEDPNYTGFAHLFEHLMFRGSKNVAKIDKEIEHAGGDLNAFTSQDVTTYHETFPAQNIETAFWVEADRMQSLLVNSENLKAEKDIVTEEFKQTRLNQPYGDAVSLVLDMAFKQHPYKWETIGQEIAHVQNAPLETVQHFFDLHYTPQNAVAVVSGNVKFDQIKKLAEKYFGEINKKSNYKRNLPVEPQQTERRFMQVEKDVPIDTIFMGFHIDKLTQGNYYASALIANILSNGESSRLIHNLVKDKKLFSSIGISPFEHIEPGLLYLVGRLSEGVDVTKAEEAIWEEFENLQTTLLSDRELEKVKNQIESDFTKELIDIKHRAINLAYFEIAGSAERLNEVTKEYSKITAEDVRKVANEVLRKENASVLHYLKSLRD